MTRPTPWIAPVDGPADFPVGAGRPALCCSGAKDTGRGGAPGAPGDPTLTGPKSNPCKKVLT